jgi:Tol biopolymer transport system component
VNDTVPSRTVGRFELLERVGSGGMGEVYRAVDTAGGGIVAVKLLPPAFAAIPERLARFRREAEISSSLSHPNIVRVIEIGRDQERDFIAMEFVEGCGLAEWCERHRRDLAAVLRLLQQVGDALAQAHAAGVLHRDLKPANVRVTPADQAKLLDFGLAEAAGDSDVVSEPDADTLEVKGAGRVFGTMAYMSPEQARGHPMDRRGDVFGFGILLYEAAAGIHPFPGAAGLEALTGILRDDPIPSLRRRPGIPWALERVLAKALQKDPARRYQFMEDLLVDLKEVRRLLESGAPPRRGVAARLRWWHQLAAGAVVGALLGGAAGPWSGGTEPARPLAVSLPGTRLRPLTQGGFAVTPALSADGSLLAYAQDTSGSYDIMLMDLRNGRRRRLTEGPVDELRPAFSPDGRNLAYATGDGRVCTVPIGGGAPQTIADTGAEDPVWSPDGKSLAYRRGRRLFVAGLSGGEERALTAPHDLPVLQRAAWSPDGEWLVFPSVDQGRYVLARAPARGGPLARIGDQMQALGMPSWVGALPWMVGEISPPRDHSPELWAVSLTPSAEDPWPPIRLFGGVLQHRKPTASQDGRLLAFEVLRTAQFVGRLPIPPSAGAGAVVQPSRLEADAHLYGVAAHAASPFLVVSSDRAGLLRLWKLPLAGGSLEPFREGAGADEHPAWSPDGRWVAFSHIEQGKRQIAVMSATGGELTYVSDPQLAAYDPAWSPSGDRIAFTVTGTEWAIRVSPARGGGAGTVLASGVGRAHRPSWSPDGRWLAAAVRTPDGRSRLIVVPSEAGGTPREVVADAIAQLWLSQGLMVYARRGSRGEVDLWSVPVSAEGAPTGPEEPITRLPANLTVQSDSGIASDGSSLYFMLEQRLDSEIWLAEAPAPDPAG